MENISKGNYDVDFQHEVDHPIALHSDSGESTKTSSSQSESAPAFSMIESALVSFYKSAAATAATASGRKDSKDPVENSSSSSSSNDKNTPAATQTLERFAIHLQLQAYDAELVSLYAMPYISRTNVKRNPTLLAKYRKMLEKPSIERAPDLDQLRKRYLDSGTMESTVIAQVLVWCNEVFFVKGVGTGKVVQGQEVVGNVVNADKDTSSPGEDDDTTPKLSQKKVPHLVRMEMIVKTKNSGSGFINDRGNWEITDIDDHLNGNLVV
jgi:hypothetical protein